MKLESHVATHTCAYINAYVQRLREDVLLAVVGALRPHGTHAQRMWLGTLRVMRIMLPHGLKLNLGRERVSNVSHERMPSWHTTFNIARSGTVKGDIVYVCYKHRCDLEADTDVSTQRSQNSYF